jgi:hypothetical protein
MIPDYLDSRIKHEYPHVARVKAVGTRRLVTSFIEPLAPIPAEPFTQHAEARTFAPTIVALDTIMAFGARGQGYVESYRVGIHGDTAYVSRWDVDIP